MTTTYFQFNDSFYEQTDGAAMGSPLSPILANIYMEFFEELAISMATKKPSIWLLYVDDTFVTCKHGEDNLKSFLGHLNSIKTSIQFTMEEEEEEERLPFLDVMVQRNENSNNLSYNSLQEAYPHRQLYTF